MKIKTYHSDSVESAIRRARLELGDEAMLLESKKTPTSERHLGLYEVLFAVAGTPPTKSGSAVSASPPTSEEFSELRRGIEQIRRMLYSYTHTCYLPTGQLVSQPGLAAIYQDLTANDVHAELAAQLAAGLTTAAERGASGTELEADLKTEIEALVPVSQQLGRAGRKVRTAALVGPTGVGKTTTIAKLVVQFGLQQRRAVHLLSIDNYRVAAIDQLQTYASILGVELTAVEDAKELPAALDRFEDLPTAGPDLVLIDTPGHGFKELGQSAELARVLSSRADIDTHLVLSASTNPKDLRQIIEKYTIFGPRKLLFTKLDETLSFGSLLNESVRTQWPLSFLGVGQRIPEDLIPATKAVVAEMILKREVRPAAH